MFPSAGTELEVKPGGLLVALVAFTLTRATVLDALALGSNPLALLAQFTPLLIGLGLSVFGVSLAVSTYDRAFVNTVARWFLLGTLGMFAVVGLAFVATDAGGPILQVRTSSLLANVLIGGAAAGVLLGVSSASTRRHRRELARRNDQAVLLNRLLRHEVLNALTVVRGQADLLAEGDESGNVEALDRNADRIENTIGEVGFLVRTSGEEALDSIHLAATIRDAVAVVNERVDGIAVTLDDLPEGVHVRADDHLQAVFTALLSHAVEFGGAERIHVGSSATGGSAEVYVSAAHDWFGPTERAALLDGLPEFDDPTVGYDVSITRLLVDQYGGDVSLSDDGATVVVSIPRTAAEAPPSETPGVDATAFRAVTVASLVAGVLMGVTIQTLSGGLPVIGALYGVESVTVGWITHLFHSLVFGVLFAAVLSRPWVQRYVDDPHTAALVGVVYGVGLWLVAAGLLMSLWLNLLGISTPFPSLGRVGLVGHVLWGGVLGGVFTLLRD